MRFVSARDAGQQFTVERNDNYWGGKPAWARVVRREITSQGRSRAFINGALATAGALKDLSNRLVELHGQHEHQQLLDPCVGAVTLGGNGDPVSCAGALGTANATTNSDTPP